MREGLCRGVFITGISFSSADLTDGPRIGGGRAWLMSGSLQYPKFPYAPNGFPMETIINPRYAKRMAPLVVFGVDRNIGLKFTVLYENLMANNLVKMNSEKYMDSEVKIPGKRLYSPNLRDVAVLESAQSRF